MVIEKNPDGKTMGKWCLFHTWMGAFSTNDLILLSELQQFHKVTNKITRVENLRRSFFPPQTLQIGRPKIWLNLNGSYLDDHNISDILLLTALKKMQKKTAHMLHVRNIYQHLSKKSPKCR